MQSSRTVMEQKFKEDEEKRSRNEENNQLPFPKFIVTPFSDDEENDEEFDLKRINLSDLNETIKIRSGGAYYIDKITPVDKNVCQFSFNTGDTLTLTRDVDRKTNRPYLAFEVPKEKASINFFQTSNAYLFALITKEALIKNGRKMPIKVFVETGKPGSEFENAVKEALREFGFTVLDKMPVLKAEHKEAKPAARPMREGTIPPVSPIPQTKPAARPAPFDGAFPPEPVFQPPMPQFPSVPTQAPSSPFKEMQDALDDIEKETKKMSDDAAETSRMGMGGKRG